MARRCRHPLYLSQQGHTAGLSALVPATCHISTPRSVERTLLFWRLLSPAPFPSCMLVASGLEVGPRRALLAVGCQAGQA